MKRLKVRSPLLWRYAFSYVSMVVLTCIVIGGVTLIASARELSLKVQQQQAEQVRLATEYLYGQHDMMQEIAYRVQETGLYKPSHFRGNNYREYELVQDLKSYSNHSQLTAGYFLLYPDSDVAYYSGGTCALNRHLATQYWVHAQADMYETLIRTDGFAVSPVSEGYAIASFELNFPGGSRGVLCFVLADKDISRYVRAASGLYDMNFSVFYDGVPIIEDAGTEYMPEQLFSVVLHQNSRNLFDQLKNLTLPVGGVLALCLVALLGLAVAIGYQSYLPIKKVLQRHRHGDVQERNEFKRIANMMDEMDSQMHRYQNSLRLQSDRLSEVSIMLRQQIVKRFLTGGAEDAEVLFAELQIPFEHPLMTAAYLKGSRAHSGEWEDLSTDESVVFSTPVSSNMDVALLLVCRDEHALADLSDRLTAQAERSHLKLGLGPAYKDPHMMAVSYLRALLCTEESTGSRESELKLLPSVQQMIALAEVGDELGACQALERMNEMMMLEHASSMARRCILGVAADELVKLMYRLDMDDALRRSEILPFICDPELLTEELERVIHSICVRVLRQADLRNQEKSAGIVRYVCEHACDYGLNLSGVAELFGLSEKRINSIIRDQTGMTFKELVTHRRMDTARDLLIQGDMLISELTQRTGYANVSHFIKVFKEVNGCTPARYRALATLQPDEKYTQRRMDHEEIP